MVTGSFGVEGIGQPEHSAPALPQLAAAKTMVFATGGEAAITNFGELKLTVDPANDTNLANDTEDTITLSRLPQSGQRIVNAERHLSQLRDAVTYLRRILVGWINLDSTTDGNERLTNRGRNTICQDSRAIELSGVFGVSASNTTPEAETAKGFKDAAFPGTRSDGDTASHFTAADDLTPIRPRQVGADDRQPRRTPGMWRGTTAGSSSAVPPAGTIGLATTHAATGTRQPLPEVSKRTSKRVWPPSAGGLRVTSWESRPPIRHSEDSGAASTPIPRPAGSMTGSTTRKGM